MNEQATSIQPMSSSAKAGDLENTRHSALQRDPPIKSWDDKKGKRGVIKQGSPEHTQKFCISTFYKFIPLPHYQDLRVVFARFMKNHEINGTILLASEGINSTIAGTRENIHKFYEFIRSMEGFEDLWFKESHSDFMPFKRKKVRLKEEIVSFRDHDLDMKNDTVGHHINPDEWDEFLSSKKGMVIDARNNYELLFGSFKGAINPDTQNFSDLTKWFDKNMSDTPKDTPIAMCCTSGIRCEKASAYLRKKGFNKVYQLNGGITKYLEQRAGGASLWEGECYVFDDRIAVDSSLDPLTMAPVSIP